jgi:hypothetical protein
MSGKWDTTTGLWTVPIDNTSATTMREQYHKLQNDMSNIIYEFTKIYDATQCLHAAAFSSVKSTFLKAIDVGNFAKWPTLTTQHVKKYLEKSDASIKGHMNQQRKNVRSTQHKDNAEELDEQDEMWEPHLMHKTNLVYVTVQEIEIKTYANLTGHFKSVSIREKKYILTVYDFVSNNILAQAMKNRSDTEAIRAYTIIYDELTTKGLKLLFQTMDNEASTALKTFLTAREMKFQLVPPHVNRQNAAERAIRTLKNHLLAGICSTDKQFPLHLWGRLIPHAVITLNLLRQQRINPKLSAYAQLNGPFDFNRTPVAPLGARVIFHEKPQQRRTWAPHGIDGFYLGPEMEHYRCHQIYCSSTGQ